MKRKLIKFSNYSFCITLPKKAVDQLGWTKGQEVDVTFDSKAKKIIVNKSDLKNEDEPDKSKKINKEVSKGKKKTDINPDDIQPIPQLRW